MRRAHVKTPFSLRVDPSVGNAATGKNQGMDTLSVEDGKFDIAIEWRSRNWLPHNTFWDLGLDNGIDSNQRGSGCAPPILGLIGAELSAA